MLKKISVALLILILAVPALAAITYQGSGRKTVTGAGIPEYISATARPVTEITFCALSSNTGIVVIGKDAVASLTTRTGIPLSAGDCFTYADPQADLSTIKIDSTVSGEGVTYEWFDRK